jgi:hypothetical protein
MKKAVRGFALFSMLVGLVACAAPSRERQTDATMTFCEAYSRPERGIGREVIASGELIGSQIHGYSISSPDCDVGPGLNKWVGLNDDPEWKADQSSVSVDGPHAFKVVLGGGETARDHAEPHDHLVIGPDAQPGNMRAEPTQGDGETPCFGAPAPIGF